MPSTNAAHTCKWTSYVRYASISKKRGTQDQCLMSASATNCAIVTTNAALLYASVCVYVWRSAWDRQSGLCGHWKANMTALLNVDVFLHGNFCFGDSISGRLVLHPLFAWPRAPRRAVFNQSAPTARINRSTSTGLLDEPSPLPHNAEALAAWTTH